MNASRRGPAVMVDPEQLGGQEGDQRIVDSSGHGGAEEHPRLVPKVRGPIWHQREPGGEGVERAEHVAVPARMASAHFQVTTAQGRLVPRESGLTTTGGRGGVRSKRRRREAAGAFTGGAFRRGDALVAY